MNYQLLSTYVIMTGVAYLMLKFGPPNPGDWYIGLTMTLLIGGSLGTVISMLSLIWL